MTNEYYGAPSTPISDFLVHYGIKGMKWGVRKQNPDGSLTKRGLRKIAKTNYGYLSVSRKHKRDLRKGINRGSIVNQYNKEWEKLAKKSGYKVEDLSPDINLPRAAEKKLWDKYKDAYAGAALRDLKMKDTKAGRASVKKHFNNTDLYYSYGRAERIGKKKGAIGVYDAEAVYERRRNTVKHPILSKYTNKKIDWGPKPKRK